MPSVSPGASEKLTPSTALTTARRVKKYVRSCSTVSKGSGQFLSGCTELCLSRRPAAFEQETLRLSPPIVLHSNAAQDSPLFSSDCRRRSSPRQPQNAIPARAALDVHSVADQSALAGHRLAHAAV